MSDQQWIVLARVEGEESIFPEEERLTPEIFQEMVQNYDPDFLRAPVISGFHQESGTAGPSHFTGEYTPPKGFVTDLAFDGLNLLGQVDEVDGRVSEAVADGFLQRSIAFWRFHPEMKGGPYLRHVALLGGEVPGIPNMPALTEYFTAQGGEVEGRNLAGAAFEVRSILDNPVQITRGKPHTTGEETMNDDLKAEVKSLVSEAVTDELKEIRSLLTKPAPAPVEPPETGDADGGLQSQVKALAEQTQELLTQNRTLMAEAKQRSTDTRLDSLVRAGRMTPAERATEGSLLKSLSDRMTDEELEARFQVLEVRSPLVPQRMTQGLPQQVEVAKDMVVNTRRYTLPKSEVIDPRSLELLGEAKARAGGDPKKFREAAYAVCGEPLGDGMVQ